MKKSNDSIPPLQENCQALLLAVFFFMVEKPLWKIFVHYDLIRLQTESASCIV